MAQKNREQSAIRSNTVSTMLTVSTMFTLIRAIVLAHNYISEQSAIRSNTVSTMFTLIRAIVLAQNYISEQSDIRSNTVSTTFTAGKKTQSFLFPGVLIRPKIPTATPFGGGEFFYRTFVILTPKPNPPGTPTSHEPPPPPGWDE